MGIVSLVLLLLAMLFGSHSAHAFQDAALSDSLHLRSLSLYEATRNSGMPALSLSGRQAQLRGMTAIRGRLHNDYPEAVEAMDPAWNAFTGSLQRTGQVSWQTADALGAAADALTRPIEHQAATLDKTAAVLSRLGMAGLLSWLAASGFLLTRRWVSEAEKPPLAECQGSRDLFLRSLNALQEGYLIQDRSGAVLLCNAEAERLRSTAAFPSPPPNRTGQTAERPEQHFLRADGSLLPTSQHPGCLALETGLPQEAAVLGIPQADGNVVWLSMAAAPIFGAGQSVPSATVLTFRDISEKKIEEEKNNEEELLSGREFQQAMLESLQEGIIACDAAGQLTLFNRPARKFHGLSEGDLPAEPWSHFDLFHSDGVTPLQARDVPLFRALAGEVVQNAEIIVAPRNFSHHVLLASGQAIYSRTGKKIGAVVALRDVTARRQIERELARLAAIVQSSEEAILAMTLDGTLVSWNAASERLYGYAEAEVIGQHVSVLAPAEEISPVESVIPRLLRGELIDPIEAVCCCRDGQVLDVALTFSPIHDVQGQIIGLSCIARDITARRQAEHARQQAEHALRQSEEALRAMLSGAPVILYAADADGSITLSEGTGLAALGLVPGEVVGRSVFEFSDGDPIMAANTRRALAGETVSYDARFGTLCLHAELRPQRDPSGTIKGIIGVCFDITERAQSEERFRVLFEQSSDAHLLLDDTGIIDCNHAAVAMLGGTDKSQVLARHPATLSPEFQPDGQRSDVKCVAMDAAAYANGYHRFEWIHRKMDDVDFPVEVTLTPVTLQGKPVLLVVWHDLTERKRVEQEVRDYSVILEFQKSQLESVNRELEALATTDGLTGLKNHRTFQENLAEEHTRAVRYHQPLSLLLLDVDEFKQYNDCFGHPAGDAVLRQVATVLGQTARDTDVAARYGGEEFVVILPQTDEAGALAIAERVRTAIAETAWDQRLVTVSLGVSTLSLDTPTSGSLLACADKALYQSKTLGRNQVSHGNPSAPPVSRPPRAARPKHAFAATRSSEPSLLEDSGPIQSLR